MTREELYELVWSTPISKICNEYPVADARLKAICKELNIPLPETGHWQKIQFGKKIVPPPLPENSSADSKKISSFLEEITQPKTTPESALATLTKIIQEDSSINLVVPDRLANPDKLILQTREALENEKRNEYHRPNELLVAPRGNLDIRVTSENASRALRFMDTLIKALRARRHNIRVDADTYAFVLGRDIRIILREKTKRIIVRETNWNRSEYHPTGILALQIDDHPRAEYSDGKFPLENLLAKIIAKLELTAKYWNDIHEENEREERAREEKEKAAREIQKRKEKERSDFKKLLMKATRWHESNQLRNYIDHAEAEAVKNNCLSEQDAAYFKWARQKADKYDPTLAKKEK